MGLALAFSLDDERLTSIDVEPLGERRALLVLGWAGARARFVLDLSRRSTPPRSRRSRACCASG